ncbi:hypothetical protein AAC387_Pa01g2378 [Persea americana]
MQDTDSDLEKEEEDTASSIFHNSEASSSRLALEPFEGRHLVPDLNVSLDNIVGKPIKQEGDDIESSLMESIRHIPDLNIALDDPNPTESFKKGDLVFAVKNPLILVHTSITSDESRSEGPYIIDKAISNGACTFFNFEGDRFKLHNKFLRRCS